MKLILQQEVIILITRLPALGSHFISDLYKIKFEVIIPFEISTW